MTEKRYWWMTLKERQEKFKGRQNKPAPKVSKNTKPKKRRGTYQWGAQAYLAGFEIGETRCHNGKFKWSSLRSIGSMLKRYYGVLYTFKVVNGKRTITRVL